ncbi:biopolymer transport protein ExbD [Candidatus Protochlamydia naegleriophila]|uniref:Biopolymer transport protein ExbD n=1 Tax=Candidatus Protochlamydia naegleriophila TaxID=389348 RepID=A0A0U5JCH6_9BACT|nr:biopolymer transporter ExbD [Candidatus Protochlamydia naegleriophila]CUI17705.1 biopolymer transport protein ExbD [Candidatus Protochlamydia naegleriophila]
MKFKTRLKTSTSLIDLTPLVDVIFLMLIFFIVTSDILPLKSLNIENPTLDKDSAPLTTQLLLVMDAQQVIYLGSKKAIVDLSSLKAHLEKEVEELKRQNEGHIPTIVLSVDQRVEYGLFLKLFAIAQECCPHLRLVYKPLDGLQNSLEEF